MNSMPPKLGETPSPPSENWWTRLPTWGKWAGGILAVIILLGIGAAIGGSGSKEDDLKNEVASLEAEVKSVEGEKQEAESESFAASKEVAALEGKEQEAVEAGEREAAKLLKSAEGEATEVAVKAETEAAEAKKKASSAQGELASVEAKAESMESHIDNLRGEESEAKEVAAKSEIEDGVWQAERDYIPGTYEAPGGSACYWSLLSEPGGGGLEGIIENGGFNKHQILNIESPYFETRDCGVWHRVE
jgi:hypothetical protein